MVSIIIAIWNQLEYTQRCIESLFIHTSYPFELILIDNASDAPTKAYLKEVSEKYLHNALYTGSKFCRDIRVFRNEVNKGFVKAANFGIQRAKGEYLLLNNDTEVTSQWLNKMVACLDSDPRIMVVNPLFNNPMPGGFFFEPPGHLTTDEVAALIERISECKYPDICTAVGFCMLIRREALTKYGFLDEAYGMGIGEESDYCMRVTEGGDRVVCADNAYVYHKGKLSFGLVDPRSRMQQRNLRLFLDRWKSVWERDVKVFNEANELDYLRSKIAKEVQNDS